MRPLAAAVARAHDPVGQAEMNAREDAAAREDEPEKKS